MDGGFIVSHRSLSVMESVVPVSGEYCHQQSYQERTRFNSSTAISETSGHYGEQTWVGRVEALSNSYY